MGVLSLSVKWPVHSATTHHHPVLRLGRCGDSYVLPPYTFLAWYLGTGRVLLYRFTAVKAGICKMTVTVSSKVSFDVWMIK
jgi:hypothetical protein